MNNSQIVDAVARALAELYQEDGFRAYIEPLVHAGHRNEVSRVLVDTLLQTTPELMSVGAIMGMLYYLHGGWNSPRYLTEGDDCPEEERIIGQITDEQLERVVTYARRITSPDILHDVAATIHIMVACLRHIGAKARVSVEEFVNHCRKFGDQPAFDRCDAICKCLGRIV